MGVHTPASQVLGPFKWHTTWPAESKPGGHLFLHSSPPIWCMEPASVITFVVYAQPVGLWPFDTVRWQKFEGSSTSTGGRLQNFPIQSHDPTRLVIDEVNRKK